jgi:hypothetical protein
LISEKELISEIATPYISEELILQRMGYSLLCLDTLTREMLKLLEENCSVWQIHYSKSRSRGKNLGVYCIRGDLDNNMHALECWRDWETELVDRRKSDY